MQDEATDRPPAPGTPLGRRLLVLVGVVAAIVVVYVIASATVPRWWAQRIGDQVDGSITAGIGLGLFYGFVFTFLPLLVLSVALRRGRSWRSRAWICVIALALALPNLMTLGIVLGTGSAAHAGERILDVEAPDFRGASLVGAILGAAAVGGVLWLLASRRRAKARETALRQELRGRADDDAGARQEA